VCMCIAAHFEAQTCCDRAFGRTSLSRLKGQFLFILSCLFHVFDLEGGILQSYAKRIVNMQLREVSNLVIKFN